MANFRLCCIETTVAAILLLLLLCIFILLSPNSVRRQLVGRSAHFSLQDYFVIRGIRTCLGVSDDPMFLWISSNSCPLNLLLVRSHQAEIIILKHLFQGHNTWLGCRLNPDHSIRVVVKTTPLPIRPRCRLIFSSRLADWLKKLVSLTSSLTFLNIRGIANLLMKMLTSLISGIGE